jgi:hypothetical protein
MGLRPVAAFCNFLVKRVANSKRTCGCCICSIERESAVIFPSLTGVSLPTMGFGAGKQTRTAWDGVYRTHMEANLSGVRTSRMRLIYIVIKYIINTVYIFQAQ